MPDSGAAPAIYPARPTISVGGTAQPALGEGLQEMLIEETAEGLYRAELTFTNYGPRQGTVDFLYFDRTLLDFGTSIKVEAGAGDGRGTLFEGRISSIEGRYFTQRAPEILVQAEDRLQDLRMTRRTRTFAEVSDSSLFQQVASTHSLQAQVDVDGGQHDVLAQLNQSDLAFLRERARAIDAELWVDGTTLHVQARSRRRTGTLTLSYQRGLHEFSVSADLAEQVSGFQVSGWDVKGKQTISYRATDSTISGELEGATAGSAVLAGALGTHDQQVVHTLPVTQAEAQALAEAHYRRTARRFVVGHGVAEGDARLRVGAKLELNGLGPMFNGKYQVTRAAHCFDLTFGYRTLFTVERPGISQ